MKPESGSLNRFYQAVSELIYAKASQARIRFQEADSTVSESADQSLLRRRIRAAATLLLVAKFAFTVRSLLLRGQAAPLDGIVLAALLLTVVWLYSPRNVSVLVLRTIEVAIFWGMSLQLGLQLHYQLRELALAAAVSPEQVASNAILFVASVKDQIIATFGMIMIYGMFIPNTPQRASLIVLLMIVTPGAIIVANRTSMEAIESFRQQHIVASGIFSGNLLALAVGAGGAIYGTAVMNRWRSRALEAEQLGQYRLKEKIGSGGMGDVYLAEHRLLKRLCAVKLIRAHLSDDPVMLSRFEREVQVTATLTHWNTVQVFDYGQTLDGTFFYVMEHLHGRNLRQMVTEFGPMPEDRVIFIVRQICEALREAAARGLVHRDIKPSNVFLAHAGERYDVVKLLDFGLVRPVTPRKDTDLSVSNELKGSPRYMCPEQAQGLSPDFRGDIYSLGATAFFMLSGRPPFDIENTLQLVVAHATQVPPTLTEVGVSVSRELQSIIIKCLQKKPEDRYQNPDEVLTALSELDATDNWSWQAAETWWQSQNLTIASFSPSESAVIQQRTGAAELDETVIEERVDV